MSTSQDDLDRLLALRDALDASINAYATLSVKDGGQEERKKPSSKAMQTRHQIWATAAKIVAETANPVQEATRLAFMVSMSGPGPFFSFVALLREDVVANDGAYALLGGLGRE